MDRKTVRGFLVDTLENLEEVDLERLKHKLEQPPFLPKSGLGRIPDEELRDSNAEDLGDRLIKYYTEKDSVEMVAKGLEAISLKDEADKLLRLYRKAQSMFPKPLVQVGCANVLHIPKECPGGPSTSSTSKAKEYHPDPWESVMCDGCPNEENLPEKTRPKVVLDLQGNHQTYSLCPTEAGSFHCSYTNLIFEVRGAVSITYEFASWPKKLDEWNTMEWMVAGPLLNIQADPEAAVAAVHFPHFLCLSGEESSQIYIAHFVEGGMSLEKPDVVGPSHAVLKNPSFSPRGAIFKKSWFTQTTLVYAVALLYQSLGVSTHKFHLYLLPNDPSLRKAVHEHELSCASQRVPKPPETIKPLRIGSRFFVQKLDDVMVSPMHHPVLLWS